MSQPSRVLFTSYRQDWATPKSVYRGLDHEFHFTLDPCPARPRHDGLRLDWSGERVFCNPPYGREMWRWLAKAHEAELAVFLIPSRTDTSWWHDYCLNASEIRFIRGRLRFDDDRGRATFPSAIVIFR